jgi:hypothetical protein
MMMRRFAFCLALLATAHSVPATAAEMSSEDRQDLSCLIFFADLGNGIEEQSEEQKIGFSSILAYFYGKIIARNPVFDLNAALTPEVLAEARASSEAIKEQCSEEAGNFGTAFTAAAEKIDS